LLRVLLLLLSSLLVVVSAGAAGSAPLVAAGALQLAAAPPYQEVLLARQAVARGEEQSLAVTLAGEPAATTILQLTITYPDGTTQEVLDQTVGRTATITWQVPATAAPGVASFELQTSGCGCGERTIGATVANPQGLLAGAFAITE
jgi:hypothetical protein